MPARVATISLVAILLCTSSVLGGGRSFAVAKSLQEKYCIDCHVGEDADAGLDLTQFEDISGVAKNAALWSQIATRVGAGEMPPPDSGMPLPEGDEVEEFVRWVHTTIRGAGGKPDPGPAPIRRLNRYEYNTTVRDLLGVHVNAGQGLPADGGGGAGFDNAAETLFISPVHSEKYLEAARTALRYMATDPPARQLIFVAAPGENRSEEAAARLILERFMTRAFRRPIGRDERERYLQLFQDASAAGQTFPQSVMYALEAVLISPHFLFRVEHPNESPEPVRVSDFELATRLSYFLWSSLPDNELLELAAAGKLYERTVLREQVVRMLDTRIGNFGRGSEFTKARALAETFIGQWLGTRALGSEFVPDKEVFPNYDYELEFAIKHEPIYLFEHMLVNNRPLLDLLDCNYTYLTRELAAHYGLDEGLVRRFGQMEYAELPADSRRGGVLTMAAVLAVSSYPQRTSPVLRGKWILEKLFETSPPPPPPDAPQLSEDKADIANKTLRERLEIHRQNATCAACHSRMDPLGFGLENYDAIGRWRSEEAGRPVDARGTLPNGQSFSGPQELKQILLARKADFVRMLTRQLLSYAIGRGLVDSDYIAVERIVARLEANDYKTHELILGIVESVPFQYKPGNDRSLETATAHAAGGQSAD